ncbi:hypothetical protein EV189_0017 [Motilibacter rhizosphaerae]|uniref:HD domain-containing protein n=1 Tax=Motilibacter rhizosphaerae TaxID=598652 RepID=A0A4Q7NV21_9ACTN|nr:hypothetical protein [Motilibacter rhizosphaerae]RZS90790.1 hypothetical protein EV189_0017 [Motilibacter rhizosphaerae]
MSLVLADWAQALRDLGDLKRVRHAAIEGSVADDAFLRSWARLVEGEPVADVAESEVAAALAAARLGGIDVPVLVRGGLAPQEAFAVVGAAAADVSAGLPGAWAPVPGPLPAEGAPPAFARALVRQPRAGATYPGRPRVLVEPPESHGDHCFTTGVYAALLAPLVGAPPADAYLLGLAHHLHNAVLPDSGYSGEVFLGDALDHVLATLTGAALQELPEPLRGQVAALLPARDDAETPLGRAFHAADVLDRVLQVHHHARAAAFTADQALVDLDIVHPGPVQDYQLDVLAGAGLLPQRVRA